MHVDAVIVGAHKCGTTSLLEMLSQHPQIATHISGQWPYFLVAEDYREQFPTIMRTYFESVVDGTKILVRDTSLSQNMQSLSRLRELCPSAALIMMVREPVSRTYSAYLHSVSQGYDPTRTFDDVVNYQPGHPMNTRAQLITNYVEMGFYYSTLERMAQVFPREQIVVLKTSDLWNDPASCCQKVFAHLGLDDYQVDRVEANKTGKVRSKRFEVLLKKDLYLKAMLRQLLPLKARVGILRYLKGLNKTHKRFAGMSNDQRRKLTAIFQAENEALNREYGIDSPK